MKYPRTLHLPWSPGGTSDDKRMLDVSSLLGKNLVFTEKMDGSNVCLEHKIFFARSHVGPPKHASFDNLKAHHAEIRHLIPNDGTQIFGEWLFAKHSIQYSELSSYLNIFGVRLAGEQWASWDEVKLWATELGVVTVPTLATGFSFDTEKNLQKATELFTEQPSRCGAKKREGIVVRISDSFSNSDFSQFIAKWVRKDHVQTEDHWSHQEIVKNEIKKEE